jgi:hypothetical protein
MSSVSLKVRLSVVLLMLLLGFIGVVLTDISKEGAWNYWRYVAVIYAILSLCLNRHLKAQGWKTTILTIWHEIAHWTGLIVATAIVAYFVHVGLLGRFEASILTLLLLALATYIAGVYIESTLLIVGIMLGIFAMGIAFLDAYLYNILLPLTLIVGLVLMVFIHRAHKKLSGPK